MTTNSTQSSDLRAPLWITLMALLSVAFSFAFECAAPFAAFAAAAAITLPGRQAYVLVGATWLANQLVGYLFLGYPQEAQSFLWGVGIAFATFAATYLAILMNEIFSQKPLALRAAIVFAASAVVYQLVMLSAALEFDGMAGNTVDIVLRVTAIDAAAYALLLTIHKMGKTMDIVPQYNHQ